MFGSIAYNHVHANKMKKLDPHTRKHIFTGYGESSRVKHTNYLIHIHTSFSLTNQSSLMRLVYLATKTTLGKRF